MREVAIVHWVIRVSDRRRGLQVVTQYFAWGKNIQGATMAAGLSLQDPTKKLII